MSAFVDLRPAGPGVELCGARVGIGGGAWCDLPKGHQPIAPPSWLHAVTVPPTMGGPATEPGKELVGPLPTVTFTGGPDRWRPGAGRLSDHPYARIAYDVPRNTLDPRYSACTDHHVACDCREAELAEQLNEHRAEWASLRSTFRRALVGHQVYAPSWWRRGEEQYEGLCLCSGCTVVRAHGFVLRWGDVDHDTGRVAPTEAAPMGWVPEEVPF